MAAWQNDITRRCARFSQPAQPRASLYAADWQPARIKLIVAPQANASPEMPSRLREVLVELRAIKPSRPRDARLFKVPEPVIKRSAIDRQSVFWP
jgi:hypothetical protein